MKRYDFNILLSEFTLTLNCAHARVGGRVCVQCTGVFLLLSGGVLIVFLGQKIEQLCNFVQSVPVQSIQRVNTASSTKLNLFRLITTWLTTYM